jgi:hypothetical protein
MVAGGGFFFNDKRGRYDYRKIYTAGLCDSVHAWPANRMGKQKTEVTMFSKQEKRIIIMSLLYFKNDYSPQDQEELDFALNESDEFINTELEAIIQKLVDDFIEPTRDCVAPADRCS